MVDIINIKKLSLEDLRDKYFGVYPSNLFECFDGVHDMHYIFSLKNTSPGESEELLNILRYCGAKVSCDLGDATPFSAIIVDHNDKVDFEGPAFMINYIKDCLQQCKLLDISSYRQDATKDIPLESSCMSVVYFRHLSWNDAIGNSEKNTKINSESSHEQDRTKPKAEKRKMISKNPRQYSDVERYNILKYIMHHKEYSRIKGRQLWMIMERKKVCPGRTWQSMKEHFLKKILLDFNSYSFLTEEEKEKIKSFL